MTVQPLTGILIGAAMVQAVMIMVVWHGITGGGWRRFPAGRVLMVLLAVIAAILTLATSSSFFPAFPGRSWAYIVLYLALNLTLGWLGFTIVREQTRHNSDNEPPPDQ